ncbi:uncharacterized protein LOC143878318 [Tasmannia lanceolata]|uniref:uncharacterized protein LOC143878318 n=1 Tax=Tasmannia lanceolata TaxID=3420 RepID=UPI0040649E0C
MKLVNDIFHPCHRKHKLKLKYTEIPFRCDGCKEAGIGFEYECEKCEFDLHKACALARSTITHPFFNKCDFGFYYKTPGSAMRICDACREDVRGFVYHCPRFGFDLHPCCANLPQIVGDGRRNLYLCKKLSSPCIHCGVKGLGWSYRSECKNYNLHVACVKELKVENWLAMYLNVDKNKVTEIQTRIPVPPHRGTLENHGRMRGGKVYKWCKIGVKLIGVIVSVILGHPTPIFAEGVRAIRVLVPAIFGNRTPIIAKGARRL